MARASKANVLMAATTIADLTRLVEQHGGLPVQIGLAPTLITPNHPKVVAAAKERSRGSEFVCHRPLPGDSDTTPVIHFS